MTPTKQPCCDGSGSRSVPTIVSFAADVTEGFSLLRQRSWLLDVIPAPQIDLRCVYGVQLWDTGRMWTTGYAPRPLYIDQPDSPIEVEAPIYEELDFEIVVHSRD